MQELVMNHSGQAITTSRVVAEKFGKEHKNVIQAILNMDCSQDFRLLNFKQTPYTHPQNGQTYHEYIITRDGFTFLVMGFTGSEAARFKEEYITAFNKMEAYLRAQQTPALAVSRKELAQMLLDAENEIEQLQLKAGAQEKELKTAAPKVRYHDEVLQSQSLMPITVIAKELNMSGEALNKKLHELGIQYKLAGQWVLYAKYHGQGWTGTKTATFCDSEGRNKTVQRTYWTEKGRQYIHCVLNPGIDPATLPPVAGTIAVDLQPGETVVLPGGQIIGKEKEWKNGGTGEAY